ncbi:MAG: flagellar biosynthesis protein FlhA [Paracoccus sp. (in: a-proteobacteria)]|uniref:flagellar biosynthesis protein FlhA n=1 Tax=Paracoccus sp. TaxID=267 RepID=UPI0026DFAB62|nr:flagellar biosynthesis protein FlhA [Paracoccus sp. (in: a-proteobacteria)]MDO5621673.1 flagellar biosynthesis protein FlhA [Paracoccus sp. (in: a-proteobacteria)]
MQLFKTDLGPNILRSLAMTGGLVVIVLSMVIPIPAGMLDVGIAISIATATLVLVMASLVEKPTDFQAFPVLLLVTLLIRLSLNVSSTRLILTEGHTGPDAAGMVINGFAAFVAGGSLMVGLTVFGVITVVNFMVITKGSGRMAEVSARFALDSLPGKQLSIDGDLNSGAIDHAEAKARRDREQKEISFFGSLDGASKFVKGDAIAGLVITMINLLVGLGVGILAHGMPVGDAMSTYSQLTIGDGLVSQIPSLITSMAAALLLSRGGTTDATSDLLTRQFTSNWQAPAVVAGAMLLMAVVPGMPTLVFVTMAAGFGGFAWWVAQRPKPAAQPDHPETAPVAAPKNELAEALDTDELAVEIASDLIVSAMDEGRGLAARIGNLRMFIARRFGIILPDIRITDGNGFASGHYVIRVNGVVRGRGFVKPHEVLALASPEVLASLGGQQLREPVYNSPACWIATQEQEIAMASGATVVTAIEVLSTHLMEIAKNHLSEFLNQATLMRLVEELKTVSDPKRAERHKRYFEAMIPDKVAPEKLLLVLKNLLDEQISIRNLPQIVDTMAEFRQIEQMDLLTELVRKRLRGQITQQFADPDGKLHIINLHPKWETRMVQAESDPVGSDMPAPALGPQLADALKQAMGDQRATGREVVLAVPDHRRRMVRSILSSQNMGIPVLGLEEIDPAASLELVGQVEAA